MKNILLLLLLIFSQLNFTQNCNCRNQPELKEIITCKKTTFKNGAKIYRQFNCDSSWVIFQNKNKKTIFSLDKSLIDLTGKLGFVNWFEYKKTFLVENHTISGCCEPYEYILYDKTNGKELINLGRAIYISKNSKYPYYINFRNENLNYLSFLNLDNNKTFKIALPKSRVEKTIHFIDGRFPEILFENGQIINGIFKINYKYKKTKKGKWLIERIIVDLDKQCK